MITLPYTFQEMLVAVKSAEVRQYEAELLGCKDRMPVKSVLDALEIHTVGALAELKVSQWLGRKVQLAHGTFKDVADCGHDVEVRAVRKEDGKLVIRDNDPTDRRYILTYVSRCSVKLLGWLEGYLALERGVRANPGGYKEAWFVSQDKLWDMESFERYT
jgi:hypothetical protein